MSELPIGIAVKRTVSSGASSVKVIQYSLANHHGTFDIRATLANCRNLLSKSVFCSPNLYRQILFSDEAHFWLNGYVNKQNCRIWSGENPKMIQQMPMHPEKCTVWCGLYAGGIIGPYFFKNQDGKRVTVNGDRYRAMISDYLIPNLDGIDLEEMWFQQDGATCHTATATIDLLKEHFGEKIISRNGPVNWPPRSCDLTPLDYFLWGYVKSLVYADKPATIDALEANITRTIADIRPQLLEKVVQNWTDRIRFVRGSRGGHMPEIVFKH